MTAAGREQDARVPAVPGESVDRLRQAAAHIETAERLLHNLRDEMAGSPGTPLRTISQQERMIAEAQVHATLALALGSL